MSNHCCVICNEDVSKADHYKVKVELSLTTAGVFEEVELFFCTRCYEANYLNETPCESPLDRDLFSRAMVRILVLRDYGELETRPQVELALHGEGG